MKSQALKPGAALTKDIAQRMADNGGLSYKQAKRSLDLFVEAVLEYVGEGKEVRIDRLLAIQWCDRKVWVNRLLKFNLVKQGVKAADLPPHEYRIMKAWRITKTRDALRHAEKIAAKRQAKLDDEAEISKYINGEF